MSTEESSLGKIMQKSFKIAATLLASGVLSSGAVLADTLEEANSKLSGYGYPPMLYIPSGLSPLVSEFGRGSIREEMRNPILVQFAYPSYWVVQKTSVNVNGEAGTISANDYLKGDSAFLYVMPATEKLSEANSKAQLTKFITRALSQKGDLTQDLKVYSVRPGSRGVDGQQYYIVDFAYQLNTEAGFLVSRRAVASVTDAGQGFLQGLVAVTTDRRWGRAGSSGGLESTLRNVADSFRVYRLNSGIFSANPAQN
eukprot:gene33268-40249_t